MFGTAETSDAKLTLLSVEGKYFVKVGKSGVAKCSVTFRLLPGESQSVSAEYQSTGLITFKPDTGDLVKQVKKDVGKVLGNL